MFTAALMALAALAAVVPALAMAGRIPAQQTIEDDLFIIGQEPVISGVVQGNVFVVGRDVRLEGEVQGSVFALTDQLAVEGRVAGSLYAAALSLRLNAGSQVEQSLYAAALNLVTEREAAIGRDLRAVAVSANLRGGVGRNTQARIGLFELWRALQRGVTGGLSSLPIDAGALAAGMARYAAGGLPAAMFARLAAPALQTEPVGPPQWLQIVYGVLALLLVGMAAAWLFPVAADRMAEQARLRPLAALGAGAVVLVNGYLLPVLITVLVGSAFFGLIFLSIPDLAWMLFGVGFGVVVLGFSLFLLATAYLSKAIVAAMVGRLILRRLAPRYAGVRFLPLLLGLLIYVPLAMIPYLGFTIGLVATLLGLGAMWLGRRPAPALPAAEAAPELEAAAAVG